MAAGTYGSHSFNLDAIETTIVVVKLHREKAKNIKENLRSVT